MLGVIAAERRHSRLYQIQVSTGSFQDAIDSPFLVDDVEPEDTVARRSGGRNHCSCIEVDDALAIAEETELLLHHACLDDMSQYSGTCGHR